MRLISLINPTSMFCNLLLFCIFLMGMRPVHAQQVRSEPAYRLLQTAQSLMQGHQLDAAEQFFRKGMKKARAIRDRYTEAYACQGLGTLYSRRQQHQEAESFYRQAARLYRSLKLPSLANLVEGMLNRMRSGHEQLGAAGRQVPANIYSTTR